MTKPAILVHPPLGLFELQLSAYEVAHWPTDRADIRAAITVGYVGISNAMIDALPNLECIVCFGVGVDGIDPLASVGTATAALTADLPAGTYGIDVTVDDPGFVPALPVFQPTDRKSVV